MSAVLIIINIICAYYGYKWAMESFEQNRNGWGWAMLIASAWNMAALLNMIF